MPAKGGTMLARIIAVIVTLVAIGVIATAVSLWIFDEAGPIITLLNDSDPHTRANAARRLGRMKVERAYDPLIRLLHDDEASVRIAAAEALGDLCNPKALRAVARTYKRDVGGIYGARYEKAIKKLLDERERRKRMNR